MIAKLNFQHDPSEINLICWLAAQETFRFIINVENNCADDYDNLSGFFDEYQNLLEIYFFCNILTVFPVTFQFNVSLLNKINFKKVYISPALLVK